MKSTFVTTGVVLVSSIIGIFIGKRLARVNNKKKTVKVEGSEPAKYQNSFLEIDVPDPNGGPAYVKTLLQNDICIERAIRNTEKKLYIYINVTSENQILKDGKTTTEAIVKQYLSDTYAQTWDLAIVEKKLQIDVRVFTNFASTGTAFNPNPILMSSELDAIFIDQDSKKKKYGILQENRKAQNVAECKIIPLENESAKFYNSSFSYFEDTDHKMENFETVMLGGTFDKLHNGHKKLLTLAASMCVKRLFIGVMSDKALSKKSNAHLIKKIDIRIQGVQDFLAEMFPHLQADVEMIEDGYGPSITDPNYDALIVSSETVPGGKKINEIRSQKGFKPLHIAVTRRTASSILSSSFIRENFNKFSTKMSQY